MSNYVANLYDKIMYGYKNKDVSIFERSSNAFLKICLELDELLQSRPELTLHEHLKEAGELAAVTALQAVGVPWWLTTGVNAFGNEAEREQGF